MKKIIYAVVAMAMLTLSSCQKEDVALGNGSYPEDNVVRVSTSVNALATRSGETATEYAGENLGLMIANFLNNSYSYGNIKWTKSSGAWSPESQMLWKNATESVAVMAYAPYLETEEEIEIAAFPFKVQTDQSAGTLSSDLVAYYNPNFVPANDLVDGNIPVAFDHKLSQLNFAFTFGNEFEGVGAISSVKVIANSSAKFQLNSDLAKDLGEKAEITAFDSGDAYSVIVPPQEFEAGETMVEIITTDGRIFGYQPSTTHTFASGTAYTINLRIGKDKLEIDDITVSDWETGDSLGEGNLELASFEDVVDSDFLAVLKTIDGIDANNDGEISNEEVAVVTDLTIGVKSLSSLKGIEYFTALETLDCNNNSIGGELDLSSNTKLKVLKCHYNYIESLVLSKNTKLTTLNCQDNMLSELNVLANTELTELICFENGINSLDLSANTKLTDLQCYNNRLNNLDLSANTELVKLNCKYNKLTVLDVSMLNKLTSLDPASQGDANDNSQQIYVTMTQEQKESGILEDMTYVTVDVKE